VAAGNESLGGEAGQPAAGNRSWRRRRYHRRWRNGVMAKKIGIAALMANEMALSAGVMWRNGEIMA
jgi:hypothetical protein